MPTEKVVLVLNTNNAKNIPMTIDFEGNTNYHINFEFGDGTNVGYGCSATLNGDFWVFGGLENEQQVSYNIWHVLLVDSRQPPILDKQD